MAMMTEMEYCLAKARLEELKGMVPLKITEAAECVKLELDIQYYEEKQGFPKLTFEEEDLKKRLTRILGEYKAALDEHDDCRPTPTENPAGKIAKCAICQGGLGWWCPVSKDHLCEYGPDRDKCLHCKEPGNRSHLDLV
jgi:hypothetical protein